MPDEEDIQCLPIGSPSSHARRVQWHGGDRDPHGVGASREQRCYGLGRYVTLDDVPVDDCGVACGGFDRDPVPVPEQAGLGLGHRDDRRVVVAQVCGPLQAAASADRVMHANVHPGEVADRGIRLRNGLSVAPGTARLDERHASDQEESDHDLSQPHPGVCGARSHTAPLAPRQKSVVLE